MDVCFATRSINKPPERQKTHPTFFWWFIIELYWCQNSHTYKFCKPQQSIMWLYYMHSAGLTQLCAQGSQGNTHNTHCPCCCSTTSAKTTMIFQWMIDWCSAVDDTTSQHSFNCTYLSTDWWRPPFSDFGHLTMNVYWSLASIRWPSLTCSLALVMFLLISKFFVALQP